MHQIKGEISFRPFADIPTCTVFVRGARASHGSPFGCEGLGAATWAVVIMKTPPSVRMTLRTTVRHLLPSLLST